MEGAVWPERLGKGSRLPGRRSADQVSLAGTKQRMVPLIGERQTMPRATGLEVPCNTLSSGTCTHLVSREGSDAPATRRYSTGRQSAIEQQETPLPGCFSDSNQPCNAGSAFSGGAATPAPIPR